MEKLTTLFILLLSLSYQSASQVCSNNVPGSSISYHANAPPFKGVVVLRKPDCSPTAGRFACPYSFILGDNEQLPAQPNLNSKDRFNDIGKFLVWPSNTDSPYLLFTLPMKQTVTAINIEFLNYPDQNFSLPNLELYKSSGALIDPSNPNTEPIDFTVVNNNGLSQDDHRVTNISLIFSETSRHFLLRWKYTGVYNLDFFVVSEVDFCLDTQPPIINNPINFLDPQVENSVIIPTIEDLTTIKTLVLNCTVSVAGLFEWKWRIEKTIILKPPKFHIFTADGTRTTKLKIMGLSVDDAGAYACDVRHRGNSIRNLNMSRTQSLCFPVIVDVSTQATGYLELGQVALTCKVYGFLRSTDPPTWLSKNDSIIDQSSSKYLITSRETSQPAILNGSNVPGLRSTLTITQLSENDEGNYTCVVDGNSSAVQLSVVAGPRLSVMPGPNNHDSMLAIIGGVVGGLAVTVLIIIAIVVVTVVACHCRSNSGKTPDVPADYEIPINLRMESFPPKPEVNHAYEYVKSFNMTDNSAYSV